MYECVLLQMVGTEGETVRVDETGAGLTGAAAATGTGMLLPQGQSRAPQGRSWAHQGQKLKVCYESLYVCVTWVQTVIVFNCIACIQLLLGTMCAHKFLDP